MAEYPRSSPLCAISGVSQETATLLESSPPCTSVLESAGWSHYGVRLHPGKTKDDKVYINYWYRGSICASVR